MNPKRQHQVFVSNMFQQKNLTNPSPSTPSFCFPYDIVFGWNHSILGRRSHHEDLCVSKHWGVDARHSSLQGACGATTTIGQGTPGCSTGGGEHDPETCINSWEIVYLRTNWGSNCTKILYNDVWVVSLTLVCRKTWYAHWVSHFASQLMLFSIKWSLRSRG